MSYPIFHSQYTKAQIEGLIAHGVPIVQDDYWYTWDIVQGEYVNTGVPAYSALDAYPTAYVHADEGQSVSFDDGGEQLPPQSMTIQFLPIQTGEGLPSPSNPRPITGLGGMTIYQAASDPAEASSKTASWSGTVYGGTLDAVARRVIKTWIPAPSPTTSNISIYSVGSTTVTCIFAIPQIAERTILGIMSSHFSTQAAAGTVGRCSVTGNNLYFIVSKSALETADVAGVIAWLNANSVQFIFYVSLGENAPATMPFITTLLGGNIIWSSIGSLYLTYRADTTLYINGKIAALAATMSD